MQNAHALTDAFAVPHFVRPGPVSIRTVVDVLARQTTEYDVIFMPQWGSAPYRHIWCLCAHVLSRRQAATLGGTALLATISRATVIGVDGGSKEAV